MKKSFRLAFASAFLAAGVAGCSSLPHQANAPASTPDNAVVDFNGASFRCPEFVKYAQSGQRTAIFMKLGKDTEQKFSTALAGECARQHVKKSPEDAVALKPLIDAAKRLEAN